MATAARLRARGVDVLVLEAHGQVGGCAGFYRRRGFAKIADIDFWVGQHRDDEFLFAS